ncbi:uncharacterized protein LOC120129683 [Hibiscus syriacus]|uniref:uncharacterized protein LOC120129683 n=1 Tax=Hibiscus syriacus TaxID=106335 RepID=UPI001921C641|nr:uncharacterized protein LOC120129683 [Hibiscus syriacus]
MNPSKSPGVDDFHAYFFQRNWEVVGDGVWSVPVNNLDTVLYKTVMKVSTQVLWNGSKTESFKPTTEVRKGDPLSRYLFFLCMERLVHTIQEAVNDEASITQFSVIQQILLDFCKYSRQKVMVNLSTFGETHGSGSWVLRKMFVWIISIVSRTIHLLLRWLLHKENGSGRNLTQGYQIMSSCNSRLLNLQTQMEVKIGRDGYEITEGNSWSPVHIVLNSQM